MPPTFGRAAEFISAVRTAGMNPAARPNRRPAGPLSLDPVQRDRSDGGYGHVTTVDQVAVRVQPVAIPQLGSLGNVSGQLEDHGFSIRPDCRVEDQRNLRVIRSTDRKTS